VVDDGGGPFTLLQKPYDVGCWTAAAANEDLPMAAGIEAPGAASSV
jgi:hypothetical protein